MSTLRVGEVIFTSEPVVIHTTLGTCVAVTLHDPETGCGGMCHALMPRAPEDHGHPLRYADYAIRHLLEAFEASDIPFDRLEARVIGGVIRSQVTKNGVEVPSVGKRNATTAIECLRSAGLRITSKHTGGERSRKMFFVPSTGETFVRLLPNKQPRVR